MEITYKKDINHSYILFRDGIINTEMYQVQMVLHNLIDGVLPCSILRMDQKDVWRCECTGMQSLEIYCQLKELNKANFVWILNSLLENIQEIQDFLIDVNCMYLTPGEIYIDGNRIVCCIVPFYNKPIWESLGNIVQFLLHHLDSSDNAVTTMAYRFFRVLSEDDCSMERLWSLLYEGPQNQKKPDNQQNFFENAENEESCSEESSSDEKGVFLKKTGYLFPGAAALFLLLYLFFNFWTMNSIVFIFFIVNIVFLIGLSILFYLKWGRCVQEINPLLERESETPFSDKLEQSEDISEDWEERTVVLTPSFEENKTYLIRKDTGEQFQLREKNMIIGKNPDMVQILIKEPAVSRIHAAVIQKDNTYYLQDLNSKNGTYVNGRRIENQEICQIGEKDEIIIANVPLYLQQALF